MRTHNRPPARRKRLAAIGLGLLTAGMAQVTVAQARFYDPSNVASPSGNTTGYELYRTIGCPGQQLLGAPCPEPPVAAKPAATPAPAVKDSDGDGVPDDKDRCPGTPPGAKVDARGCELDSDGDGVIDRLDKCPNTPAGARIDARGCELDSDGDGVVDRLDRCPGTPPGRKVDAQGCELDSDGDGVVDVLDQCPDTPKGDKVDARGCTLANTIILRGVNFDNDSAEIRADARPILDEAVATLKRYPWLKVEVAGHTDSRASRAYNLDLSQRRAQAVMDYFVQMGIEAGRLSARGYGESQPIADNATAEGRAANRRVELRILP
ncbi:MAG: OmpA family protein [Thiobacillaceae bacterium]